MYPAIVTGSRAGWNWNCLRPLVSVRTFLAIIPALRDVPDSPPIGWAASIALRSSCATIKRNLPSFPVSMSS